MIKGAYRLAAFSSCDDVLAKLAKAGEATVGPYGFSGLDTVRLGGVRSAATPAMPEATGAASDQAYSGTNDQEVGVDEPDPIKTDGHRIVTIANGVLHIIDAASRKQTGALRLSKTPWYSDSEILLSGDHALIITSASYGPNAIYATPGAVQGGAEPRRMPLIAPPTRLQLTLVDLGGAPSVLATYAFDGMYLDARQVGSTVRVVVRSSPNVQFPYRQDLNDSQRVAANRKIVAKMSLDDWLPHFTSTNGGVVTKGRVPCATVTHPEDYSGTNMVNVLSFDLASGQMGNGDAITVVADADTVYASPTSLYIASDQRWRSVYTGPIPVRPNDVTQPSTTPPSVRGEPIQPIQPSKVSRPGTEIYRFDTSQPGTPQFVGGGLAPGYLINQYAMSEWNGSLRVATTDGRTSSVYVMSIGGGELRQVGHVGGLGRNQRIYAVRFLGAAGYVVTFRQVDPLYIIDLSDPQHPTETGSLELSGYSAYLHPMDDTHLIGVGQDADAKGHLLGMQVSIFDVTQPTSPKLVAHDSIPNSGSAAERDPHAFLYWPPTGLLVVPVQQYDATAADAIAFHVTDGSLARIGRVSQAHGADRTIQRSLIIGSTLWTLSRSGLMASDMTTLHEQAYLAL